MEKETYKGCLEELEIRIFAQYADFFMQSVAITCTGHTMIMEEDKPVLNLHLVNGRRCIYGICKDA